MRVGGVAPGQIQWVRALCMFPGGTIALPGLERDGFFAALQHRVQSHSLRYQVHRDDHGWVHPECLHE